MAKLLGLLLTFVLTCGVVCAQNSNSSTTTNRQRTTTNTNRTKPVATETQKSPTPAATPKPAPKKTGTTTGKTAPGSEGVTAAFNALLNGIRHANVDEVMDVYVKNPRLT